MALQFSEHFWGKNNFDVIGSHLEHGKESLKLFSSLMIERASIEKKYTSALEALHKQASKLSDYPGFEEVINVFRGSIEQTCGLHNALIPVLKDEIGGFVESFKEEQKKRRKATLDNASKHNNELKALESQSTKLKEKYHKLAKENEANQDNLKKAKPKDQAKAQQKQSKSQSDMEKAESEYRDHIMKIISFLPTWETQIENLLRDLQQQEEERVQFLKQQFVKYGHAMHQIEPVVISPQIIHLAENVNPENEINRFVHEKQTGTSRPQPPDFEPFGEAPVSLAPKSAISPRGQSGLTSSTNSAQSFNPNFPPNASASSSDFNPSFPPPSGASLYQPPQQSYQAPPQQSYQAPPQQSYQAPPQQSYQAPPQQSYQAPPQQSYQAPAQQPAGGGAVPALPRRAAPPVPAAAPKGPQVRVLYDYPAQDANELSMKAGQIIPVLEKDPSGWWTGELDGRVGVFPSNYTEEI